MTVPEYRREPARRALSAWSAFPADRQDRPLVLLSGVTMPGSFRTGEQKLVFLRGAIDAVPGFPLGILTVLRGNPSGHAGPPLTLTFAVKGSTGFSTDRGRRPLPAWKVGAAPGGGGGVGQEGRQLRCGRAGGHGAYPPSSAA